MKRALAVLVGYALCSRQIHSEKEILYNGQLTDGTGKLNDDTSELGQVWLKMLSQAPEMLWANAVVKRWLNQMRPLISTFSGKGCRWRSKKFTNFLEQQPK